MGRGSAETSRVRRAGAARSGGLGALHVDPADRTPLYLQVRKGLLQAIRDGVFKPDDALPSERDLAEGLGVSRVTARKAIEALSSEGIILRRHGSGNYIAPLLQQPLSRLSGFTEELRQRGFKPSSRWLRRALLTALPDEIVPLGLSPGARVAKLERVRMADAVPMAYEVSVLPADLVPHPEAVKDSLYAYLEAHGAMPVRALQHFRATSATAQHAELLAIPLGTALLYVSRIGYLADGRTVELTHTFCRSDHYDFVVELRR